MKVSLWKSANSFSRGGKSIGTKDKACSKSKGSWVFSNLQKSTLAKWKFCLLQKFIKFVQIKRFSHRFFFFFFNLAIFSVRDAESRQLTPPDSLVTFWLPLFVELCSNEWQPNLYYKGYLITDSYLFCHSKHFLSNKRHCCTLVVYRGHLPVPKVPWSQGLSFIFLLFGNLQREALIEAPNWEKRKPLVTFMLAQHLTAVKDVIFFWPIIPKDF